MGQGKHDIVLDVSTTSKLEGWVLYMVAMHKMLLIRQTRNVKWTRATSIL